MDTLTLLNQASFWIFAALMVLGALGVVFHRSIVYSALLLLVTFLAIAGVFALLNAPFIAAAQILVYGVGLTIVLIFGIMLTGDQPFLDPVGQERPKRYMMIPGVIAVAFLGFLMWALLYPNYQLTQAQGIFVPQVLDDTASGVLPAGLQGVIDNGGIVQIAQLLFQKYLVAFELASILLLLAMVGAIILSKRVLPEEEGEPPVATVDAPILGDETVCSLGSELSKPVQDKMLASVGQTSQEHPEKETLGVH